MYDIALFVNLFFCGVNICSDSLRTFILFHIGRQFFFVCKASFFLRNHFLVVVFLALYWYSCLQVRMLNLYSGGSLPKSRNGLNFVSIIIYHETPNLLKLENVCFGSFTSLHLSISHNV